MAGRDDSKASNAGLTDDEIAALDAADDGEDAGDDLTIHGKEIAQPPGNDEPSEDEAAAALALLEAKLNGKPAPAKADKAGDDDEDDAGDDEAEAKAAAEAAAAEAARKAEPAPARNPAPLPIITHRAPVDAKAVLDDIAKKEAALDEQYEAGDISFKDHRIATKALADEALNIRLEMNNRELQARELAQREEQTWVSDAQAFLTEMAIDTSKTQAMLALDRLVLEWSEKQAAEKLTNRQVLEKAYAAYVDEFGTHPPRTNGAAPLAPYPKPKARMEHRVVQTLKDIPASDISDAEDGGVFAALDSLLRKPDPRDFETFMGKLEKTNPALAAAYQAR